MVGKAYFFPLWFLESRRSKLGRGWGGAVEKYHALRLAVLPGAKKKKRWIYNFFCFLWKRTEIWEIPPFPLRFVRGERDGQDDEEEGCAE